MPPGPEALARRGGAYRWLVVLMAMISTISAVLSATIINVAIPDIMGSFGIDQVEAQWVSAGFLAAMVVTMVMVDYACKTIGQRAAMLLALLAFLAGALIGGFAQSSTALTLGRLIQGAASGMIQPLAMIAVFQVFPPERRGTAMGIYGTGAVLAPALGPYFGGLLVDTLNWRYVFFVGVPPALAGIVLSALFMPSPARHGPAPRFDWPAFVLLNVFLVAGLTAFADGPRHGWNAVGVQVRFALAALACVGFIAWERRASAPMLDMRIYSRPAFAGATLVSFILGAGLFGSTYLVPVFVQTVQGLTPTLSGALLLPAGLAMIVLTPLTGRLADRVAPGYQITFGLALFAISFALLAQADVRTGAVTLAVWIMVSRIGMAFIFPALSAGGVRALPPELLAQGASSMNFVRQIGGAYGVNLLAVLLSDRTASFGRQLAASQTPANAESALYLRQITELGVPLGLADDALHGVALAHLARALHGQAAAMAFNVAFLTGAAAFIVSIAGAVLMLRSRRP